MLLCLSTAACGSSGISSTSSDDDEEVAIVALLSIAGGLVSTTAGAVTTEATDDGTNDVYVKNRRTIEVNLARGHGDWIADLAHQLALPAGLVPHLGEVLRRHREPLSAVLVEEPLRASVWERKVADVLCCDAWLYPFVHERLHCRPPAEAEVECLP